MMDMRIHLIDGDKTGQLSPYRSYKTGNTLESTLNRYPRTPTAMFQWFNGSMVHLPYVVQISVWHTLLCSKFSLLIEQDVQVESCFQELYTLKP